MRSALTIAACLLLSTPIARADDAMQRAMHDELGRSLAELHLDASPKPYFVSYQVEQLEQLDVQASLGALEVDAQRGYRIARIDVRVGDPSLDSSRMAGRQPMIVELPVEDDYAALRRTFWLATDQAYKHAVEDLATKRGVLSAHDEQDRQPDHTPVPVAHLVDEDAGPGKPAAFDRERAQALAREASRVFADYALIEQSQVWIVERQRRVRFESSEGTTSERSVPEFVFGAAARARADDGLSVWDYDEIDLRDASRLPPVAELTTRLRALAQRVIDQRKATRLENDYTGPVLFTGTAGANLFGGHFAPQLWPAPRSYSSQGIGATSGTFEHRAGSPVLPPGVSVSDDPLRGEFDGRALLSTFRVDDEGVAAAKKDLIVDGRVRQVLCTRAPVGKHCSAGNARGGVALASTLELRASQPKDAATLQADLLRMAQEADQPYALEVQELISAEALQHLVSGGGAAWFGTGGQGEVVLRAMLHYRDGHRVPVRNVRLSGINLRDFRTIVGFGDRPELYSKPFGEHQVGFIAPALLFEELTLSDDRSSTVKPPLLKSPMAR
jgi:predicted Zn-dependent protease